MTPERMASARVVFEIEKLAELSEKQRERVEKTIEKLSPKDEDEARLRMIVGKPPASTLPQLGRRAALGAALSIGAGMASDAIRGVPFTMRQAVKADLKNPEINRALAPRGLLAKGIGGAVFGLGIPYIQYLADREAAKQGWY